MHIIITIIITTILLLLIIIIIIIIASRAHAALPGEPGSHEDFLFSIYPI